MNIVRSHSRYIVAARTALAVALMVLLGACTSIDLDIGFNTDPELQSQILDQTEDQYPDIDPLALNDEITALLDSYIEPRDSEMERIEKLQAILYTEDFLHLEYSDHKTHTAIETFYAREGNCLSVMNLYVAMARHVGVMANFQTVEVQPSWDRRGGMLILSQHINATGKLSVRKRYVVDFTPEIALQQLTSDVVNDVEARALYFSNLGVEKMIEGDFSAALPYLKNALFLDPSLSIGWNNIGATYNRLEQAELAEYSYRTAFSLDDTNATAINNLVKYYKKTDQLLLVQEYEEAVQKFKERNPYYHYALGNVAYEDGNLREAARLFERSVRLKKSEPDFYLSLAQVYLDLGEIDTAIEHAKSAESLIAENAEIYRPSNQRVRVIDNAAIKNVGAPGLTIKFVD